MSEFDRSTNLNEQQNQPLINQNLIKDGSTQSFMEDVVKASSTVPVIVDFWAPNCAPCAQLTPALETAVRAANGAVQLVKINTQANPELASQFQIKTVPTVYAFKDGQPIDGFAGAMPESELDKFIKKLTGESDNLIEILELANEQRIAGQPQEAAEIYSQILSQDPENPDAIGGLMKCYIEIGELKTAIQALTMMPPHIENHAAILSAKAALELAQKADNSGDLDDLITYVKENPENHEKRFELAIAYHAKNQPTEAIDELIAILRKNMSWNEGAARSQLLEFFEAWGQKDQNTIDGRKKLATLLFA